MGVVVIFTTTKGKLLGGGHKGVEAYDSKMGKKITTSLEGLSYPNPSIN